MFIVDFPVAFELQPVQAPTAQTAIWIRLVSYSI